MVISMGLRIVIAGGGTGGHLYPGIAVAQELTRRSPKTRVTFAGTTKGIESRAVPEAGFELDFIRSAGLKGKSGRDNIHSFDLVNAFWSFFQNPRAGEVYNIGGSRYANCSMIEAISMIEEITERKLNWSYIETNRVGDHIWWIGDISRFQQHYPDWKLRYNMRDIAQDVVNGLADRLSS